MEHNKSIIFSLLFSSILSFSAEATAKIAFSPSSNSPIPSPFPTNHRPSLHFSCEPLSSPARFPYKLSSFTNPKLEKVCAVTENPVKCATLIAPCISANHVNSYSALNAVILSLSGYVNSALSTAIKLSKSKSLSSKVLVAVDASIDIYVNVIEDLWKAATAFKARDLKMVNIMLIASVTNFGHCDEAFRQQGLERNWPLKRTNRRLVQVAGFGLDFYEKLIVKVQL